MPPRRTTTKGFKRTNSLLSQQIRKASETRGFAQSRLLTHWAEIAGEALIRPEVFRAVAEEYGYRRDMAIPGPIGISTMLKPLDDGRVCAVTKSGGPCQLIFAQAPDGRWRLSGFAGDLSRLRINR